MEAAWQVALTRWLSSEFSEPSAYIADVLPVIRVAIAGRELNKTLMECYCPGIRFAGLRL